MYLQLGATTRFLNIQLSSRIDKSEETIVNKWEDYLKFGTEILAPHAVLYPESRPRISGHSTAQMSSYLH